MWTFRADGHVMREGEQTKPSFKFKIIVINTVRAPAPLHPAHIDIRMYRMWQKSMDNLDHMILCLQAWSDITRHIFTMMLRLGLMVPPDTAPEPLPVNTHTHMSVLRMSSCYLLWKCLTLRHKTTQEKQETWATVKGGVHEIQSGLNIRLTQYSNEVMTLDCYIKWWVSQVGTCVDESCKENWIMTLKGLWRLSGKLVFF